MDGKSNMPQKITKKTLKIGFDFDGVVLYNPARVLRPFLGYLRGKKKQNGSTQLVFYHPKKNLERWFWWLAHQSSLFPARGLQQVRQMVSENKIEAYVITGRSTFLKSDFERRLKSIHARQFIKQSFISESDEQPHEFKAKMINSLKLDCYVEDNWNIAQYLVTNTKARIFWISNVADFHFTYPDKYLSFEAVVEEIRKML